MAVVPPTGGTDSSYWPYDNPQRFKDQNLLNVPEIRYGGQLPS